MNERDNDGFVPIEEWSDKRQWPGAGSVFATTYDGRPAITNGVLMFVGDDLPDWIYPCWDQERGEKYPAYPGRHAKNARIEPRYVSPAGVVIFSNGSSLSVENFAAICAHFGECEWWESDDDTITACKIGTESMALVRQLREPRIPSGIRATLDMKSDQDWFCFNVVDMNMTVKTSPRRPDRWWHARRSDAIRAAISDDEHEIERLTKAISERRERKSKIKERLAFLQTCLAFEIEQEAVSE